MGTARNRSIWINTDEQGNIVVTSDGKTLSWSATPSDSWAAGVEKQEENDNVTNQQVSKDDTTQIQPDDSKSSEKDVVQEEQEEEEEFIPDSQTTYVLNTNTKKFHYSYCSSAADIKAKNRKEVTGTRDDVIGMGYDPCKRCNP